MRSWQVYFWVLTLCGVAAITIPWVYHQKQVLTETALSQNENLWLGKQPSSYSLRILVNDGGPPSQWNIRVGSGKILAVSKDGQFQANEAGDRFLPTPFFGEMRQWLEYLKKDEKPPFVGVQFHPQLGYPLRAVLRRKSPVQRLEIQMVLEAS